MAEHCWSSQFKKAVRKSKVLQKKKATVIAPKIGNITFDSETSSQVSYQG